MNCDVTAWVWIDARVTVICCGRLVEPLEPRRLGRRPGEDVVHEDPVGARRVGLAGDHDADAGEPGIAVQRLPVLLEPGRIHIVHVAVVE